MKSLSLYYHTTNKRILCFIGFLSHYCIGLTTYAFQQRRINQNAILLIFIGLCFLSTNLEAQIPSNVSVKAFINQLTEKVTAKQLSVHQTELVTPLALSLGNAKVHLTSHLDEPIGDIPVEALSILVSLNDIVNQFAAYNYLDDLNRQINELPFYLERNNSFPLIERISPEELLLVGNSVDINLEGHFIDVQKEDFHASIVLNSSTPVSIAGTHNFSQRRNSTITIMPIEKKANLIRFQLPLEYLANYRKKTGLIYLSLDLAVPQKSEDSLNSRKIRYSLPFTLLPSSPGEIHLSYQQTSTTNKTESRKTRSFVQHSTGKYISENYYIPQKDNEKVLYESAKLVVDWSDGQKGQDWSYYKQNTSKGVCFTVETVYNPVGISGKLNFHIEYEVKKNTTSTVQKSNSVVLDWNDYQRFDIGHNTNWKLQFTDYTGDSHTYRQPVSTQLLNISKSGRHLIVTTSSVDAVVSK